MIKFRAELYENDPEVEMLQPTIEMRHRVGQVVYTPFCLVQTTARGCLLACKGTKNNEQPLRGFIFGQERDCVLEII